MLMSMNAGLSGHFLRAIAVLILLVGVFFASEYLFPQSELLPEASTLAGTAWDSDRYKSYFTNLAQEKGALYAFNVLGQAPLPPHIETHALGHAIGYVLYEQQGPTGMRYCTHDFTNACAHSVLIQTFIENGAQALSDIANVCKEIPGGAASYPTCFHGVGHGILAYLGYDYENAVSRCTEVEDAVRASDPNGASGISGQCVGGATMELIQGNHDKGAWEAQKGKYLSDADLLSPCNASFMPDTARPFCYSYLTGRFLRASGAKGGTPSPEAYPKAFSYCEKIPKSSIADREGCYGGFGSNFVNIAEDSRVLSDISDRAIGDVHAWCALAGDPDGEKWCVSYAMDTVFWTGNPAEKAARRFCDASNDGEIKDVCFGWLISSARFFYQGGDAFTAFCDSIPEHYRMQCSAVRPSQELPRIVL